MRFEFKEETNEFSLVVACLARATPTPGSVELYERMFDTMNGSEMVEYHKLFDTLEFSPCLNTIG